MQTIKISKDELEIIYLNNQSITNTAKYFHVSTDTIKRRLIQFNIPIKEKKLNINIEELINYYTKTQSLNECAKFFKASNRYLCTLLHKYSHVNPRKINIVNHSFFSQDTEESFYWAGFIAADGCVMQRGKNCFKLQIRLSIKDIEHLQKFKNHIKSTSKLSKSNTSYGTIDKINESISISITSKQIFDDLKKIWYYT